MINPIKVMINLKDLRSTCCIKGMDIPETPESSETTEEETKPEPKSSKKKKVSTKK